MRYVRIKKFKNMKKIKKGYTLFELLVSISIIAILVALATASYSAAQKKARDARRQEDLESIRKAAEQYYMLNNSNYPTSCSTGNAWTVNGTTVLESFPKDPKGGTYNVNSCGAAGYCVCTTLENQAGNGNSSAVNDCLHFSGVGATGYYCVKNQQ